MLGKFFDSFKKLSSDDFIIELLRPTFYEDKIESIYENNNIDLNWQNEQGESYLHLCAQKNLTESISWLINKKVNINVVNKNLETPLFYAAIGNHFDATEELIKRGADVDHRNIHDRTVLQEATILNNTKIIDLLIKKSQKINNIDSHGHNLIFDAVSNGNESLISKIAHNKDINLNQIDKEGNTVLHQKAVLDNNQIALELMESGADPTINDSHGKNFLFYAATKGIDSEALVDKALMMGCNIQARSNDNSTVLMETLLAFAKLTPDEIKRRDSLLKMVKKLIKEGIDINAENNEGETALFIVTLEKDIEAISILLEFDEINVNHQNIKGETILHVVAMEGISFLDEILILLKYNVNPNIRDIKGRTIIEKLIDATLYLQNEKRLEDKEFELHINEDGQYLVILKEILNNSKVAINILNSNGKPLFFDTIFYRNDALFKLLKEHELDLNLKDSDENNILNNLMVDAVKTYAFDERSYINTLKSLIAQGADVNSRDKSGGTSVHKAIIDSCEKTLKLLIESKADANAVDNNGRNLVHSCVWKGRTKHFGIVHSHNDNIINKADKYGVTPINYAAFMGYRELVIKMIDSGAYINNINRKDKKMVEFLSQYLNNLDALYKDEDSELNKKNIKMLIKNMKEEFKV